TDIDDDMRFSLIEALWARGFNHPDRVSQLSLEEFAKALAGTVAYNYADTIWETAGGLEPPLVSEAFSPVNPDGTLVNCVPPTHLSPLGPVAYLNELLRLGELSTCDNPLDRSKDVATYLSEDISGRGGVGPLGNLLATKANLEVPIPLIDIVNETLEHMVAENVSTRATYNTAGDQVGGHELTSNATPPEGVYMHDPETLLEASPEHSTPAAPTKVPSAYETLKHDFTACNLPYSQPLDVARTYLEQLGTSRFATMRHFRRDITEFVLDPENEPGDFQRNLWRYPVRINTAIEYLGITPEEYELSFQNDISNAESPPLNILSLYRLYGFPQKDDWTETVVQVSEFLERTCLTYCEFLELWKSEFEEFSLRDSSEGFPDCEPCCLEKYFINFTGRGAVQALKRLIIFIRLWRKLQSVSNAHYTFAELSDICEALKLFYGQKVNPDFIRQLAAFQMLRDYFQLSLTDGTPLETSATKAERLHLMAFWVPGASRRNWAIDHLLDQIQQYAVDVYGCECREPEFIKLLKANLDPLSALAGFNPDNAEERWDGKPTHTLRLAEILEKIYASEFRVGELIFLFTNNAHLQGDDPFPLQTANEAKDSPLGLPDDEDPNSLWALRNKLLAVEVDADAAAKWSWSRMETTLREAFGFAPTPGDNKWLSLGQHFFPTALENSGVAVGTAEQQYRVSLTSTSERMWNTPPDGPFQYDAGTGLLYTQLPLTDEAVLAKLGRIRQLETDEQDAVRDLYFLPRVDLAEVAFVFHNFGEAEERLIQEPDEDKRWAWFQQEFARFYARCQVILEHLAAHTNNAIGSSNPEGTALADLLMKCLWGDENKSVGDWENDSGERPDVTWPVQPKGGAFAALLGLTGTGMLAEYTGADAALRWRELRGGADAFGPEENAWNAPIPTILPTMEELTLTENQLRFVAVRNGFSMANTDGAMLGGAEPFSLNWSGLVLIDTDGPYGFSAGAPTPAGELPDFEKVDQWHQWRVTLKRGQKTWILLAHDWPDEEAPPRCAEPINLKRGFYELKIELECKPLAFDGPEDVCPRRTGFQVKYHGPDTDGVWVAVPNNKLFQEKKDDTLGEGISVQRAEDDFLRLHYTSSVRDIRRTYQRAFKAMMLVNRFHLSAQPVADDGQSELGFMLTKPENFVGHAYYRSGGGFTTHKAYFDPNFLPVLDNYESPPDSQDQRVAPTAQRQQAMFDWWERLFDYTVLRSETLRSPEQPAWLLFHEA
ncbi:MAG: insecticidal toxin complex protein, partial [Candidatus Competibacteraceae bacterium]|nr:insecticidal toxin complex protein [Candidatus Competibacteraceae bacterium]